MSFHGVRVIRGDLPPKSMDSQAGDTQRGGALCDRSQQSNCPMNSQSLDMPAGGEMGCGLKTGGYSGSMHPGEWDSGRDTR